MERPAVVGGRAVTWSPWRRVATSIGLATAMVLVIAALIPRGYLANDDIGLTEYLRSNRGTPWMSSILAWGIGLAYKQAPGVPWWGLYQYALIAATGSVLIHTSIELIDLRPGLARKITWLGAVVVGASHAILVVGITWTTVSISALGTAVAAFVAHAQLCQAARRPASPLRALVYGLLLLAGYMLRPQGLAAMLVALLPLLGWATWRFAHSRHLPRAVALIAFVAPFALVFVIEHGIPASQSKEFDRFNERRGQLHGHSSYDRLDRRAPELLKRAGWTVEEYHDFMGWLILDENDYPIGKLDRLIATGGVPEVITPAWSYRQLRTVVDDSAASVFLFLSTVAASVVLALLGLIRRERGVVFGLGYLVYMVAVPLWMAQHMRFPQRVSLSVYTVAALGVFLYLARELADRPEGLAAPPTRGRAIAGLLVVASCLLGWAFHLAGWLRPEPAPYCDELRALENRVVARGGFVFVYLQIGLVDFDPLRARPRAYDGLQGGWGTFSTIWYHTLEPLGVHRGADVLGAMVDNPEAYMLAPSGAREYLEDWLRRQVGNPSVRMSMVDVAEIPSAGRPGLYRLVTTPLERDGEEWRALALDERLMAEALPGPPSVSGLAFRSVTFASPLEAHVSPVRAPGAQINLEPVPGGVRCTVTGNTQDGCTVTVDDYQDGVGHHAGVHIAVDGLRAARFDVRLLNPENIVAFNVHATTRTSRAIRWRWLLGEQAQRFGYTGSFTLVPGHHARQLALAVDTAGGRDVRDLEIFIVAKPGTRAGFELRNVEVAEPRRARQRQ